MKDINDRTRDLGPFEPKPGDDMIVCRCEEVTQGEIRKAVHEGLFTIAEIRRYLRCGMGLCQGSCRRSWCKHLIA
jgi:NAD(P)H-nitrite reductase large subunit